MAQSNASSSTPGEARAVRHWLIPYLRIQANADAAIEAALKDAAKDADAAIRALEGKSGVGTAVRRSQLLGSKGIIRRVLMELFGIVQKEISIAQKDAAQAAMNAAVDWDSNILKLIEPDAAKRRVLSDSLKAGGERNIQAMITRVLFTEMPLSSRVWYTRGLATGQVSRIVNSSLARGDSAKDIANLVRKFIDPSTRGGASYAALRLGRTEINNAFHAQSLAANSDKPWVLGMIWHLSKSHEPAGCACERYAKTRNFPIGAVPKKPHPQCYCFVTPRVMELEDLKALIDSGGHLPWLERNTK